MDTELEGERWNCVSTKIRILPHFYGHRVTEDEVRRVLARSGEDRPSSDNSRMALGQTAAGRYLRVISVPDPGNDSAFVITTYELRGKQLKA